MSDRRDFRQTRISRRTMLSAGPVAAGAAIAAGAAVMPDLTRSAWAAGDEAIKVALVGCGSRGTGAAAQSLQTAGPIKLWAVADLFADRIESSLGALARAEDSPIRASGPRTRRNGKSCRRIGRLAPSPLI